MEKSVLLHYEYFGKENCNALAVCGSNFNKLQLELLLRNFDLTEIVIAFDKEYPSYKSKEAVKYFDKLYAIGKKYHNYCNFSFLFDKKQLLEEKDAPIDKGAEVFNILLKDKVRVK